MRWLVRWLAMWLLPLLAACAGSRPGCMPLGQDARYCLQPLPAGAVLSTQQLVQVRVAAKGVNERLLVVSEATGAELYLAVLTPMGQTLGHLTWDGQRLEWQGLPQWAPLAEGLPALVQVHLWPAVSVRAGLEGAQLVETGTGRELRDGDGQLLLDLRRAVPPRDAVEIDYPAAGLWLRVEPLGE